MGDVFESNGFTGEFYVETEEGNCHFLCSFSYGIG